MTVTKITTTNSFGDIQVGTSYAFSFSKPERLAMRRRKKIKPSEWVPKYRYVTDGDFSGSPANMRVAPYTAGIMDAAVLPFVRQVAICAAPQTSKTFTINSILAWLAVFAPGPILGAYPKEVTGKENMVGKIQAMFRASPILRELMTGRRQDKTDSMLRLSTLTWRIGWSGSAVSLADWSARYVDAQEVDKYEVRPNKKETGTMELLRHRTRFYPNSSKHFYTSTPTTKDGNIWRIIANETSAVFVYWVRCPHCDKSQLMEFNRENFWWPHGANGHSVDRKDILNKKLARYVCEYCGVEWTDHHRNVAIQRGIWRLRLPDNDDGYQKSRNGHSEPGTEMFNYLSAERPSSIGFLVPSWISYMVSLSEVAHDFLRVSDKSLSPEERFSAHQDFRNKHQALPWSIERSTRKVSEILKLRDDRPSGMVPGGNRVASLLFGVDTQDNGFYYIIVAFGYGRINEQWIVRAGFVTNFEALVTVLWHDRYIDADGYEYVVEFGLQDMMGHRTKEVIDFCLGYPGKILPALGKATMTQPYSFTQKEYFPGTDRPIASGGMRAVRVNTKFFKDNLAIKLGVKSEDPGGIHLHKDLGEEFAGHLLSEVRNHKGVWEQIGSRDNHWWDCLCLANCAAEVLGLQHRVIDTGDDDVNDSAKKQNNNKRSRW